MKRVCCGLGILLSLLVLPPTPLAGQGPPIRLDIAPVDAQFAMPSHVDFELGWMDHPGFLANVEPRSRNKPNWQLFLAASSADMGGYGKSVQDLLFRPEGSAQWQPLTQNPQLVAEGAGEATVRIYLRVLLNWEADIPGSYSLPLEFSSSTF